MKKDTVLILECDEALFRVEQKTQSMIAPVSPLKIQMRGQPRVN